MGEPGKPADAVPAGSVHERQRSAIVALIPRWYSPRFHLVFPTLIGFGVMIAALTQIRELRPVELITLPLALLFMFGFEWWVHKNVLHRRLPLVGVLYERHELHHHVVYTYDDMAMRDRDERWLVLVPAYAVVLVALLNVPIAWACAALFAPNVGYLFLVTSMFFFLSYEWLHLSYHMPPDSFVGRMKVIALLREQHRRHHDPRLMKRWNFNVTVPLFDWIVGTEWSPERHAARAARLVERRRRRQAALQAAQRG